ncbi:unnamed protein product [Meganyctiphanes norvegica]|uniref:Cytochrome P450 n=1 Tax=Meganyctiphanes norvegica TaxID=48144 RepID=A0AAV2QIA6_MEGNR
MNTNGLSVLRRSFAATTGLQLRYLKQPPGPNFEDLQNYPNFDPERQHLLWEDISKKYGPVFQVKNNADSSMYFLSDASDIQKMFNITAKNPIRPFFDSFKLVREINESKFFDEEKLGILCQHGDEWWRVRSKVQVHTNKLQTIATYLPKMDDIAKDFVKRIDTLRNAENEMPENFMKELYKWALENVGLLSFNKRIGGFEGSEDSKHITEAADMIMKSIHECEMGGDKSWMYAPNAPFRALSENHDYLLRYIESEVSTCYEKLKNCNNVNMKSLNIIESLLLTPELTRKDVIITMLDFIFAAIDTTALTMAFTLYCLSNNPKYQMKLQQELDNVVGDSEQNLTPSHIRNLSITKAIVKESLRLYPIAYVQVRQTLEDSEIGGFIIPKGAQVMLRQQPMAKEETNFSRAEEFIPERWIRGNPMTKDWNHNMFAYFPFGFGTRSCVARRISEQEIYSLIARLFHKYNFEWKQKSLNPKSHLQLYPDLPLKFTVKERFP